MTLPTPLYDLKNFADVYEPSEDTFLFLDALESDFTFLNSLNPSIITEVGCGSGLVITFLAKALNNNCACFATDINPNACLATSKTVNLNQVSVECVVMNLVDNFKCSIFDVVLFNPPYVVTEGSEITGQGLNRAWAGGENGREIIDMFLQKLSSLLTSKGICYMVAVEENKPEEIMKSMSNMGFHSNIIKERKILGEHLFVLRFTRKQ